MSIDERPRGSARPAPRWHYSSLPRTSLEAALGVAFPWCRFPWPPGGRTTAPVECPQSWLDALFAQLAGGRDSCELLL